MDSCRIDILGKFGRYVATEPCACSVDFAQVVRRSSPPFERRKIAADRPSLAVARSLRSDRAWVVRGPMAILELVRGRFGYVSIASGQSVFSGSIEIRTRFYRKALCEDSFFYWKNPKEKNGKSGETSEEGANDKETESFRKGVFRIPLHKPFKEAYYTHRLWMFFRETREKEEDIRRMFCEAREKMRVRITLKKKSNPGQSAIPCTMKGIEFPHALCDIGASVGILPRVMADHLGLQVEPSQELFTFVDCSQKNSGGIVRDLERPSLAVARSLRSDRAWLVRGPMAILELVRGRFGYVSIASGQSVFRLRLEQDFTARLFVKILFMKNNFRKNVHAEFYGDFQTLITL
ncbi:hypothetical protein F2Q69_00043225 [Brassica cretica]|uniref:Uncharacterized protein n=1 Tax=Brassica cretica TaxID=69181 RepID=A0A8S9NP49_BRACR|nr:hypothetical protein F2Q69_00043225 [Brassica cretica]